MCRPCKYRPALRFIPSTRLSHSSHIPQEPSHVGLGWLQGVLAALGQNPEPCIFTHMWPVSETLHKPSRAQCPCLEDPGFPPQTL